MLSNGFFMEWPPYASVSRLPARMASARAVSLSRLRWAWEPSAAEGYVHSLPKWAEAIMKKSMGMERRVLVLEARKALRAHLG